MTRGDGGGRDWIFLDDSARTISRLAVQLRLRRRRRDDRNHEAGLAGTWYVVCLLFCFFKAITTQGVRQVSVADGILENVSVCLSVFEKAVMTLSVGPVEGYQVAWVICPSIHLV